MSDTQTSTTKQDNGPAPERRVVETVLPEEPNARRPTQGSPEQPKIDGNTLAKNEAAAVEKQLHDLDQIMAAVDVDAPVPDILARCEAEAPPDPDLSFLQVETPLPTSVRAPRRPHPLLRLVPSVGRRFDAAYEAARSLNAHEMSVWNAKEQNRRDEIERRLAAYRNATTYSEQKVRAELAALALQATNGEPEAIERYAATVVTDSPYPSGFSLQPIFLFDDKTNTISGELTLPDLDAVVPEHRHHRYIKERHSISKAEISDHDRHLFYRNALAATVLRVAHELFVSDLSERILTVALNGEVDTFDRATGHEIRVTLASLSATRTNFVGLNLARVVPTETLRWLGGRLSPEPHLQQPVLRVS